MKHLHKVIAAALFMDVALAQGQQTVSTPLRAINLQEAVEMALKHNHIVRIGALHVEEEQHAKEVARSAYLPTIKNDSTFGHLTDPQLIAIPADAFGVVGGNTIPPRQFNINQGDLTSIASGTGLTQPLTELLKIK